MLLHIIARGKIGRSPEAELVDRYMKRLSWPHKITELPDVGGKMPALPDGQMRIVAMDEAGEMAGSLDFAKLLQGWRDDGVREVRFLIGAADGLSAEDRAAADMIWSFGRATWPHMMARAMLAEQLWRATSIIANHPYHREG
jgi:23S rRNA (pseudouridine1915-N3)-methyltransferase